MKRQQSLLPFPFAVYLFNNCIKSYALRKNVLRIEPLTYSSFPVSFDICFNDFTLPWGFWSCFRTVHSRSCSLLDLLIHFTPFILFRISHFLFLIRGICHESFYLSTISARIIFICLERCCHNEEKHH